MNNIEIKIKEIKDYYPNLQIRNLTKTILYSLGLSEKEAYHFITLNQQDFEDPFRIFGIAKAAHLINDYIENGKKIIIHGDFDVDGVCASTILWDYLYFTRKADVLPIIPNRIDEGYGLSEKTIRKAINLKADLIITVDCGIRDKDLVDKFKNLVDFIITDHHQFLTNSNGQIILPDAKAVVHSAHPKSQFSTMISGAATAWQLVRAIEATKKSGPYIDTTDYLDLVAISTICDIIPLTTENRKFVLRGIEKIKENKRIGLKELMKIAVIDPMHIQTYHFGFVLGPRLNAPGRILNDAVKSMRLLATRNIQQARELAIELNDLNTKRQQLTEQFIQIAESQINTIDKAIVIKGSEWPEGILGLIASKIAEKYFRPTFVSTIDRKGKITGSSRSPLETLHLNQVLEAAKQHLLRYGGHKQAAGFASQINIFHGFEDTILEYIEKNTKTEDFIKSMKADVEISDLGTITIDDIEELKLLEPFGLGNPKPTFVLFNAYIEDIKTFGKDYNHIMFSIIHGNGKIAAKSFNGAHKYSRIQVGQCINILGHFTITTWNNTKQLEYEVLEIF
jgi:single-stranded-DNA-specific exonuclease